MRFYALGQRDLFMKLFIVNVNDCLKFSQFKPFLYEHIHKRQLIVLDEISDTCQLDSTSVQLDAYIRQHPMDCEEYAVIIFIPRDFNTELSVRDFYLYNDINVYTHLITKLPVNSRFFTFYIDKTDHYDAYDATYNRLNAPKKDLSVTEECLTNYLLTLPENLTIDSDYKEYLKGVIEKLDPASKFFFESILVTAPDVTGYTQAFQNGISKYIGDCKNALARSEHMHEQITHNDENESVRDRIKVICYVKALAESKESLDKIPLYESFPVPDYDSIKTLLATYRQRLNNFKSKVSSVSKDGIFKKFHFNMTAASSASFAEEHNDFVDRNLDNLKFNVNSSVVSTADSNIVNVIFEELDGIVKNAKDKLEKFAAEMVPVLFNEHNYIGEHEEHFDRSTDPTKDNSAEKALLSEMNKHAEYATPDYSAENRLHQKLDIIEHKINNILERLKIYRIATFFISHTVAFLSVAVFYFFTQQSVIFKEQTFMFFFAYLVAVYGLFFLAYYIVRKKYMKRILSLVAEAKSNVKNYLSTFVRLAREFEENLKQAAAYRCLRRTIDMKTDEHRKYLNELNRYNWHFKRVSDILKNLEYFDNFIEGAEPDPNDFVDLLSFTHDDEHTEFYHLKIYREN